MLLSTIIPKEKRCGGFQQNPAIHSGSEKDLLKRFIFVIWLIVLHVHLMSQRGSWTEYAGLNHDINHDLTVFISSVR